MTTNDTNHADLRAANAAEIESWHEFMDLPVPLGIELGRTKMTVEAILDLKSQSIIQLQRSTAEGVDVVAGNLYVARGEIIMIEDRTGVRISEVVMAKSKY